MCYRSKNKFHKSEIHAKHSSNRLDGSDLLTSSSSSSSSKLKITQFKDMGKKHPEVLAEWRAGRVTVRRLSLCMYVQYVLTSLCTYVCLHLFLH